jgi:large subunit ribosomal protein L6
MSRIWRMPVVLTDKVEAKVNGNEITIKWSKWSLSFVFSTDVKVNIEDNSVIVTPINDKVSAIWGTTRSIINNMVIGVSEGYTKSLEINWVWYKYEVQWKKIILAIWFSHKVEMDIPEWLEAKIDEKQKNVLHISWISKQLVWEFASKIRAKKKPEPYKWKWIKYVWEQIIRKAWKSGK